MTKPRLRCAIYTRKSTDEGLDQSFNSLDAQREACMAYVASQKAEGWTALAKSYDDGGYSGGNMERPALQDLLAGIATGRVNIVVVYKIDRLTRSLMDFARIVEIFDRHQVSFVSVTQAFNTTSSMGRLTLNVLLSFAQFEREVTGERIRDKIAASKKKGMWMGGGLPLGYDAPEPGSHGLKVNEDEAHTVRHIFETYLALGSVHKLENNLYKAGIRSKRHVTKAGKVRGDQVFSRGALFHLLRNRTYLGETVHKDKSYPGQHAAIIDPVLFDAVQQQLDRNSVRRHTTRQQVARSPLAGRIFDPHGRSMTPTFSYGRHGKLYRYYLANSVKHYNGDSATPLMRVSAEKLEGSVTDALRRLLPERADVNLTLIKRIDVLPDRVNLWLGRQHIDQIREKLQPDEDVCEDAAHPKWVRLSLPICVGSKGGAPQIIPGDTPVSRPDPVLVKALRDAHAMLERDSKGMPWCDDAPKDRYRRKLIRLAFLAPELQKAIFEGRHITKFTLARLLSFDMALSWADQKQLLAQYLID
ncbi:recombinase family protein [Roseobacter sp.]|uniref:recombinase family protein n=1 Tax=Roseobacter sp. TaxID=1907202 RepID=UPI0025DDBCE7|nr:recombinase family protein [Roseobacter sp.]